MGQDQLDKFIQEQLGQHQSPIDTDALWKSIEVKKGEEIETIVKDKLANHESAIDSQLIWNNISSKVTGKSSGAWLNKSVSLLLLIGLLSSIAIYYYSNKKQSSKVESPTTVSNKENTRTTNNSLVISTESESNVTQQNSNDIITPEELSDNVKAVNDKSTAYTSSILNKQSPDTNRSTRNNPTDRNKNLNSTYNNNNDGNAISNTNDIASTDTSNSAGNTTTIEHSNDQLTAYTALGKPEASIIDRTDSRTSNSLLSQAQSINSMDYLYMTQTDNTASDFLADLPSKDECFSWNKSVECYDYSPKKLHFSILAYTTADYYRKSMSTNSELTQNYLNNRKETQKAQISNRSGLLIKLRHRKGIYVKFGAEAGFLRERFSHQTRDTITEIVPDQLINIDVDMNGDSTFTYGNAPITTISSKNWRVNNSHRTIGIPILLGYEKEMSKFSLGIELGVLYNIHRSFEGWLLGPPDAPSDAKDYFTSSNDLNLTGGFNLNYDINNRYRLVGLATFRQNMNSINNLSINEINQKNTTFGVGVGIEFKI